MCISPVYVQGNHVPCRKCYQCIVKRQNEWIFRIEQEVKEHTYNYFLTLTYNDQNVPIITPDGALEFQRDGYQYHPADTLSLNYIDVQKFLKRLRKQKEITPYDFETNLRYYFVGEYGDRTLRPHYHAIISGVSYKNIQKAWKLGHIRFGDVNHRSIRYVIKYMSKRVANTPEMGEMPKVTMSRGLGSAYIEKHKAHHRRNDLQTIDRGGYKMPLPKYFKDKIWPYSSALTKQLINSRKTEDFWQKWHEQSDYMKWVKEEIRAHNEKPEIVQFRNEKMQENSKSKKY